MKTDEFQKLLTFSVHKGNALIPATPEAAEWLEMKKHGEWINFKHIEARDLSFHRCYFALISFIYDKLPKNFKDKVYKDNFYNFLKMLGKEYEVLYEFKSGEKMYQYKSISFGRMGQTEFRLYVNNQLSMIYEELLIPLECDFIMDLANEEFERFMDKLI